MSEKRHEFVAHASAVRCVALGPRSSSLLASGGDDCRVNVWRLGEGRADNAWTLSKNKGAIESLCFDPEEQVVVSGSKSGAIRLFDLQDGNLVRSLSGHQSYVTSLHYHPFGEILASGSGDTAAKMWDVRQKRCIQTYKGHSRELTCVRFSPDGKWVASAARDNLLLVWDLVAGKLLHSTLVQHAHVTTFAFCPTELVLAGVTSVRAVKLWDLENFEPIATTPTEASGVRGLCFSSSSKALCAASDAGAKLWTWDPLRLSASVEAGWDRVGDVRFTGDATVVAAAYVSNFVSVWTAECVAQGEARLRTAQSPSLPARRRPSLDDRRREESKASAAAAGRTEGKDEGKEDGKEGREGGREEAPEVSWEGGTSAADLCASMREGLQAMQRRLRQREEGAPPPDVGAAPVGRDTPLRVVGSRLSSQSPADRSDRSEAPTPAEAVDAGGALLARLSVRLGLLRALRHSWERGEATQTAQQLRGVLEASRHDPGQLLVAADFFAGADLGGAALTLDLCVALLPLLECMSGDPLEYVVSAALKAMARLLEAFSDLVHRTRAAICVGGIDLNRDERLGKCNVCHAAFLRLKAAQTQLRSRFRHARQLCALLDALKPYLADYV